VVSGRFVMLFVASGMHLMLSPVSGYVKDGINEMYDSYLLLFAVVCF